MKLNKISVGIIGLGYVGLPIAIEFGKKVKTFGFDNNKKRIDNLKKKKTRIRRLTLQNLKVAKN